MEPLTRQEFLLQKNFYLRKIAEGAVFIYPTDTIYGIGCDATNFSAIERIRLLKKRPMAPFSVIAPSRQWIRENCMIDERHTPWLEKLPGPYTLILTLQNRDAVASNLNPEKDTIGVRIPALWISTMVRQLGVPLVTTSVNVSGQGYMSSMDDLDPDIKKAVDFIIYDGEKKGNPSAIVDLTTPEAAV
ncbi:threonylcarbamoyl-AMP synthase, partial [Candidatus Woesearchaeota archaeon CG_4_10_14_0_8_um_filter_47_5]